MMCLAYLRILMLVSIFVSIPRSRVFKVSAQWQILQMYNTSWLVSIFANNHLSLYYVLSVASARVPNPWVRCAVANVLHIWVHLVYGWQRLAHKLIADLCPRILPREEQSEDELRSSAKSANFHHPSKCWLKSRILTMLHGASASS